MNRKLPAPAVAFFTISLIATLTGPALAATEPAIGISPQMLQALSRDLNLDAANVQIRLVNEANASGIDLKLRSWLGDRFGGSWLSSDASILNVAVTDGAGAALAGAVPRLVRHSLTQLHTIVASLDAKAAKAPKSVPGWYVDVRTNSVVVLYRGGDPVEAKAWAGAAVRYEPSAEEPRPLIDVIGGNAYFIGNNRCSVGFSVVSSSSFQGGFVTAGHCGSTGARTSQPGGVFAGSSFPGNDYAWVRVDAGNTPRASVNNYSGGQVIVQGALEAPVGASICRSGSTTGWQCGEIEARDATVNYPEGAVTGLIRTDACADHGDSGGSLLAGNQAQGVTSGGSGNCTIGGTTYFQPVNEILQAYGLWLTKRL